MFRRKFSRYGVRSSDDNGLDIEVTDHKAPMVRDAALGEATVRVVALHVSHSLTAQQSRVDWRTGPDGHNDRAAQGGMLYHVVGEIFGRLHAPGERVDEPKRQGLRGIELCVLQVHRGRERPEPARKCLRQHPEWAHATHEVAVLQRGRFFCCHKVGVHDGGNAATH
eukprot:2771241-Prymnesium_polylepis.4